MVARQMYSKTWACVAILAAGCAQPPSPQAASAPKEVFRFNVGFWTNLHQVLVHESLLPKPGFEGPKSLAGRSFAPLDAIDTLERAAWERALAYYDKRFTTRNTFTEEFMQAERGFSANGSAPSPQSNLAPEWISALSEAAPIYRAHFWSEHEKVDHAYVSAMRTRIASHAAWFVERLVAIYKTPWPDAPIEIQVTPVVPPFGASTIGEPPFHGSHAPLITISSIDSGYAGDSGVEMIFHEASHLLVDRVQEMIDASAKRQGKTLPRGLWHFVLFYTAGHVAKERLGPTYVPYAERPETQIFSGDTAAILPILVREWQPYLDGRARLEAAVDAVVAAF